MRIAIAYHAGDLDQAERLEGRMRELGPYPGHSILVARDSSTEKKLFRDCGFDSWQETVITNDAWKKWPESPNNAFRHISMHVEHTKPQPWLWLEPDCCVVRAGWLDAIAAEYQVALKNRKVFMGCFVPGVEDTPDHMSGIGVYPGKITSWAGNAKQAHEIPWDIYAARQIVPLAHFTRLIQHNWRAPEFDSLAAVRAELWPEAVIYHKDKIGNMGRLLGGGDAECQPVSADESLIQTGLIQNVQPTATSDPAPTSEPESAGGYSVVAAEYRVDAKPPEIPIGERWITPNGLLKWNGSAWEPETMESVKTALANAGKESLDHENHAIYHELAFKDKDTALARMIELAEELKALACTPGRSQMVRQCLHNAGVVKVPGYRKKRRRA